MDDLATARERLDAAKRRAAGFERENRTLKTQVLRLQRQVKRKEQMLHKAVGLKVEEAQRVGDPVAVGALQQLQSDLANARLLAEKVHELEGACAEKDAELRAMRASTKWTALREAQIEAETYLSEARSLRARLKRAGAAKGVPARAKSAAPARRKKARAAVEGGDAGGKDSRLLAEVERLRGENEALRDELESERASRPETVAASEPARHEMLVTLNTRLLDLQRELTECQHEVEAGL